MIIQGRFEEVMKEDMYTDAKFFTALIDCDLYLSHKQALPFVWDRLVHGGYMFLDDYYSLKFPGSKIAIDEFFLDKNNKPQTHMKKERDFERWFVRKIF